MSTVTTAPATSATTTPARRTLVASWVAVTGPDGRVRMEQRWSAAPGPDQPAGVTLAA